MKQTNHASTHVNNLLDLWFDFRIEIWLERMIRKGPGMNFGEQHPLDHGVNKF